MLTFHQKLSLGQPGPHGKQGPAGHPHQTDLINPLPIRGHATFGNSSKRVRTTSHSYLPALKAELPCGHPAAGTGELEGTEQETTLSCPLSDAKIWLKERKRGRWKSGKYDLETTGLEGAMCRELCLVDCESTADK